MKRARIIAQLPLDGDRLSWRRQGPQGLGPVEHGDLAALAAQATGLPLVLLVPGEDVFLARLSIPTQNRQRLLKAVPYALEDQLLDDVDGLHFALGRRRDGAIDVAVVARHKMDQWLGRLREFGLVPERLVADVFALPRPQQAWHACHDNDRVLVRPDLLPPLVMDADNWSELLPLAMAEAEASGQTSRRLRLWICSGRELPSPRAPLEMERLPCPDGLLSLLPETGLGDEAIDLLQGDYSRHEQLGKLWRPWRLAAGLALMVLLLQVLATAYDNTRLRQQQQALREQAVAIYKTAFPEARKVVNPRVQMQRKLEQLRGGGKDGGDFLPLLAGVGKVLRSSRGVDLRSIRFKKGELDLEIEVPSLQRIDELKQKLAGEGGLEVEIQSAASQDGKVRGRLRIKERAA